METKPFQLQKGRQVLLASLLLLFLVFSENQVYGQENTSIETTQSTGVREDVNEFLGYEDLLLVRYISLPYDTVMNTNMASYFVDLGFLLIIFIPLIYLISARISWLNRLGFTLLCLIFLLLAVPSAYLNKGQISIENSMTSLATEAAAESFSNSPLVAIAYQLKKPFLHLYTGFHTFLSNISGPRDGITYVVLFLLLIPLFLLLDKRIRHHDLATRTTIHFLLLFGFLWLILSSGITWYGLLMIPMLFVFTVAGMTKQREDVPKAGKIMKALLFAGAFIWAIMAFAFRYANYDSSNPDMARYTFMAAMTEYQIGRKDQDNVFDRTFPQYRIALEALNQEDQSYIYRIGTLMPFFIKKNDRRVISDNFLDFFRSLQQEFPNKQELAKALKAYGVRYIILDLNLAANDHTVEGSLRNKFEQFRNFLYLNPQLKLVTTDRILRGPDGKAILGIFKEANMTVENYGWFALYQIL